MKEMLIQCRSCQGKGYFMAGEKKIICGFCKGSGSVISWEQVTCEKCKGAGTIYV